MKETLNVERVELTSEDGRVTLRGDVGGEQLYWNMPDQPGVSVRGEPFIAALLVSAMTTGRDLRLPQDVPVDQVFLRSIDTLQTIFERWFTGLQRVRIDATETASGPTSHGRYTGYSGGVDSSYTVMRIGSTLDAAVLIDGIDFGEPQQDLMADVEARLRTATEGRGLPLVRVATNAKRVGRRLGGHWSQFIGGLLASVPLAIGAAEYTIAASDSWENLLPYGSHPLTDPLWSSSRTRIFHHGCEGRRIDKLRVMAETADLLAVLRVCYQGTAYNCGICHKCLRTMAGLRYASMVSAALPALADPTVLRDVRIVDDHDAIDWIELVDDGLRQRDPRLHRELHRLVTRYRLRRQLAELDAIFVGGAVRQFKSWLRPPRTHGKA
jgi:hypothetical protein